MECALLSNLPDILLGLLIITGFSTKKNPILYHQPYALLLGLFFIGAGIGEIAFGISLDMIEFFGILGILLIMERFISVNTARRIRYEYFLLIVALTLLIVFISRDLEYFHVGTLLVLLILPLNLRENASLLGEEIRDTLLFSSIFALLSITTFLIGFEVVSAFLYFAAILFLFLTMGEKVWWMR
ncbi:hypothetical protein [Thermococcus alcaliphilus]|uniref:hypothetical protein n=1 Tax=Thermococcus alcaliphilus TaxID=139207 RepID=UPI0020917AF2|nr:hypothetical protein [Thermococcus alcaliphilus]MCO6042114.1 hypothetical protein [Thermococcus alcaliphilus]